MSLIAIERKIAELEKAMTAAAVAEDFETAMRLRDEIAVLRGAAPKGHPRCAPRPACCPAA